MEHRRHKFESFTDPEQCFRIFMQASSGNFKKSSPRTKITSEPGRPWWDRECHKLVRATRCALREWTSAPLSTTKRSEWKMAEAKKCKYIIQAKKKAWADFISNLNPNNNAQCQTWPFIKTMRGRGNNHPVDGSAIQEANGDLISSNQEKSNISLNTFSDTTSPVKDRVTAYESFIQSSINSTTTLSLNTAITIEEILCSLSKAGKSKAVDIDDNYNKMLKNLSPANQLHLCHLFNILLKN